MNKLNSLLLMAILVVSVVPVVAAVNTGGGIGVDIITEDFEPRVWMCGDRVVEDDATEPGRVSDDEDPLVERINNYAFEGESIEWTVLVMDKNGVEKIEDVFATIGPVQGAGNDIEANCQRIGVPAGGSNPNAFCEARILEEELTTYDPEVMDYYRCTLTVETPLSMYGEYFITVEATDLDGLSGTMDENEYWFLNPVIALSIDGDIVFDEVRPGTYAYSDTLLVGNDADQGSGVLMDMFITGTDFYDSASSGAKCPVSNTLELNGVGPDNTRGTEDDTGFRYFATNGAYSTFNDAGIGPAGEVPRHVDNEGYVTIEYGIGFNDPYMFYNNAEIIQNGPGTFAPYYGANILAPGAEMAITFRLNLPEPCNGDFDTGSIYFWGEAI